MYTLRNQNGSRMCVCVYIHYLLLESDLDKFVFSRMLVYYVARVADITVNKETEFPGYPIAGLPILNEA